MTITPQNLIALLPLLIVGLTVVVVMLSIAWRRNHFLNATLSVLGLNAALVSLWFVGQNGAMDVTPLIRVDGYAMLYTGLVLLASLATCTFAYPWLEGYKDNKEEFYLLVLIAALGGILLAGANHLAALFLGIELISLPLFGLVGYAFRQKRSLEASIKYTILSAAASSFLLFGMALVYANSGNLSFLALGKSLADNMLHEPLLLAGLGLMIVGLGCAPIYPCVIHSTPAYFGEDKSQAIVGMQMACAYVGSMCMPPVFGLIAQHISVLWFPLYMLAFLVLMVIMHESLRKKCAGQTID